MTSGVRQQGRRSVALIGLRGCGKTTVGRELADLLGGDFIDTDEVVVEQAGKSIAAIFEEEGEVGFRQREREVIETIAKNPPTVISVGGGAILDSRNVEALKRVSTLAWLTAPAEVLWQRISADEATATSRPPLTDRPGLKEVEELLARRAPSYKGAAHFVMDTAKRTVQEVARDLATRIERSQSPPSDR